MALFDFDALDEALDLAAALEAGAPEPSAVDDHEDDNISEFWPDDLPYNHLLDLDSPRQALTPAPAVSHVHLAVTRAQEDEDKARGPWSWEVVYSRVLVRAAPQFEAPVVGIRSRSELLFEDPEGCQDEHWVKLVDGQGYMLKDGRLKDPKLGVLLRPYSPPLPDDVSKDCRERVIQVLCKAWTSAQKLTNFMKPADIRRLREAADTAMAAARACHGNAFDMDTFETAFAREATGLFVLAGHSTAGASDAARNGGGGGGPGGPPGGPKPWDYSPPSLQRTDSKVTPDFARALVDRMRNRHLPCPQDAATIVRHFVDLSARLPTMVEVKVPPSATLHIVGDLHGQFWDLLAVLETSGEPSLRNWYLFNGDLVDRGQFSVEVALAVMAWKLALPGCVHVNRGNHEATRLNALFGFQAEAMLKYGKEVFALFGEAFRSLPLATLVNGSVLVVHGGLGSKRGITLAEVKRLDRRREPEDGDGLMVELLWSDPMDQPGFGRSPRGGGVLFGPDITRQFCNENALLCIIRSHEVKAEGFEWQHEGRLLTVFSAANYCGFCGNNGAVCDVVPRAGATRLERGDLRIRTYEAAEDCGDRTSLLPGFGAALLVSRA